MDKASKQRYTKLVELGCIVSIDGVRCEQVPEMHHLHCGGMGMRSPNDRTIPLCPAHHRTGGYGVAVHAGKKAWEEKFGTEAELLVLTNELLGYSFSDMDE